MKVRTEPSLPTTQTNGDADDSACPECGHDFRQHHWRAIACDVTGWRVFAPRCRVEDNLHPSTAWGGEWCDCTNLYHSAI